MNCYILEDNKECFIIDPGYNSDKIIDYVKVNNYAVKGILLTHSHFDHIGAINAFNVPIYLHKYEMNNFYDTLNRSFDFYNLPKPYSLKDINLIPIDDTKTFKCGNEIISVIHTPGHTSGSVCFKFKDELYTGDTLFANSVGKWEFSTGNKGELKTSILKLIETLNENTIICPGHGLSSTIAKEKLNNPFYLKWK